VAMVKIDLIKNTVNKGTISSTTGAAITEHTSNRPIEYDLEVVMKGGGSDSRIGVDKVHVGIIGKALHRTYSDLTYSDGKVAKYVLVTPRPAAGWFTSWTGLTEIARDVLDTVRAYAETGGDTAFRASSAEGARANDPSGGVKEAVTAYDQPSQQCFTRWRNLPAGAAIASTDKGVGFRDYLAAFSTDYQKSYSVWGQCDWSIVWKWHVQGGNWVDNGSSLTVPASLTTTAFPKSAAAAGVELRRPTWANSYAVDYSQN